MDACNDACKVISQEILERVLQIMGNRGSKSKSYGNVEIDFVKEQRVDGSWSIKTFKI